MHITRVVVSNYRCLKSADLTLNAGLNIVVGDNESGKSTLLEAIHLALTGLLNGRPIQAEIHPYLFNSEVVGQYVAALKTTPIPPPRISVEVYFQDDPLLAALKGMINSTKTDAPGVTLSIEFNTDYNAELAAYVANPSVVRTLPVEYYVVRWRSFADNEITARSIGVKPAFIDASTIRNNVAASRYVVDIMRDGLSKEQKVDLALSYRMMKDEFMRNEKIKGINEALAKKKGEISSKALSVSLDTSARAGWESGVMPHLDDVPLTLVGKGEQNSIKIKLAMESSSESQVVLIEEAENHLSYSNLNALIGHIAAHLSDRQLIITTHSSFVLNKLGVESVILFNRGQSARLKDLTAGTHDYFMRLPGHDTLRLILAKRSILVEGPSDELIVQAAYKKQHGKTPLEDGVDVISVNSLAFKRFLEIAVLLGQPTTVVTDNDGNVGAVEAKYADYTGKPGVTIQFDSDPDFPTLEPQLLRVNGKAVVEKVLGKSFASDEEVLAYMKANKTEAALKFLTTTEPWTVPGYIASAVK